MTQTEIYESHKYLLLTQHAGRWDGAVDIQVLVETLVFCEAWRWLGLPVFDKIVSTGSVHSNQTADFIAKSQNNKDGYVLAGGPAFLYERDLENTTKIIKEESSAARFLSFVTYGQTLGSFINLISDRYKNTTPPLVSCKGQFLIELDSWDSFMNPDSGMHRIWSFYIKSNNAAIQNVTDALRQKLGRDAAISADEVRNMVAGLRRKLHGEFIEHTLIK